MFKSEYNQAFHIRFYSQFLDILKIRISKSETRNKFKIQKSNA